MIGEPPLLVSGLASNYFRIRALLSTPDFGLRGTSYVANGPTVVCEVKSLQWQRPAYKAFRTRRRDGLTTTTTAAVAAAGLLRCWSCFSARADSLHGHAYLRCKVIA